jgi:geranylgeranyl reductase family protein
MYDVIVVGAGPAGSSAARRCAQLGASTLLIDSAIFPRDKLCGGGLSEQAISYLDFDLPHAIIEREIYGARVHYGEQSVEVRKPYRVAVTVSRRNLDFFLTQKAREVGVDLLDGKRVSSLDYGHDSVKVIMGKEKDVGRIVIGCDGFNSVVARYVRRKHRKNEYGICLESIIPSDCTTIDSYIHNAVDIHFDITYGGYGWVFPHKEHFYVGIGGRASRLENPKKVMRDFLVATGFSSENEMKGHPIPVGGVRRKTIADRLLLAGDAAGFVDTFYGEGLASAIRSGQIAGEVAISALKKGDCSRAGLFSYSDRCKQEFGIDLQYSLLFSNLMHRFPRIFLRLLASDADVLDKWIEVPARRRSYKSFLGWLLPRLPLLYAKAVSQ